MADDPRFAAGRNIALKVPPHQYEATVRFYRDVLGFAVVATEEPGACFEFGTNRLWIDRVATLSQAEVWLEVVTNDLAASSARLEAAGVVRCDGIEQPPDGMAAFWIANPAGIVHLLVEDTGASTFITLESE